MRYFILRGMTTCRSKMLRRLCDIRLTVLRNAARYLNTVNCAAYAYYGLTFHIEPREDSTAGPRASGSTGAVDKSGRAAQVMELGWSTAEGRQYKQGRADRCVNSGGLESKLSTKSRLKQKNPIGSPIGGGGVV